MKGKLRNEIGEAAEARVQLLLIQATLPSWITGPITRTDHNSKEDTNGIDIWVGTDVGPIGIQVKSCAKTRGNRNVTWYREKGIAVVKTRTNRGYERTEEQVLTLAIAELELVRNSRRSNASDAIVSAIGNDSLHLRH